MDQEYDVIVMGTGIKESILSGLLAKKGKNVLHIDRNQYYGGECASLNITNLWKMFRPGVDPPKDYGPNRNWNVDLIPKFVMGGGKLVKMLLYTKVYRYLDWECLKGSYVVQYSKGGFFAGKEGLKIHKVPATTKEALDSKLMGLWEKNRFKNFINFCNKFDPGNPKTWKDVDVFNKEASVLLHKFKLHDNTIDFIGHAIALFQNDDYLKKPAVDMINKIRLYMDSMFLYGASPFLYPIYGLGGLPEGFSRMCAIHGGTYILNQNIDEFVFSDDGKVIGVRDGEQMAKAPIVICDPSYAKSLPGKVKQGPKVIRSICLMDHIIPGTPATVDCCQIIIPQKQLSRHNDIYITLVGSNHRVCNDGLYLAMISTYVETDNPDLEIKPAVELLGNILEQFVYISDMMLPTDDGKGDNIFVTHSCDPTSHFQSETDEVLALYERITGDTLDLDKIEFTPEEDE